MAPATKPLSPAPVLLGVGTTVGEGVQGGSRGVGSKYKMTWVIDPEVKRSSLGSVNQLPTLEV